MNIALAVLFIVHGLAHLVGFLGCWKLGPQGRAAHTTKVFGNRDIGESGMRIVGILWLLCAAGFVALAVLMLLGNPLWRIGTHVVASASALLSLAFWPEARIGMWLSLIILCVVSFGLV